MIEPATGSEPAATSLLDLWEDGAGRPPADRALLLLRQAAPGLAHDELADLTVGRRDRYLIALRERWFGATVDTVETCASCGERLELTFDLGEIMVEPTPPAALHTVDVEGYEVAFRLPTCGDLAAVSASPDVATARAALLARCLSEVRRDGAPVPAASLPPRVVEHVERAMEALDPQANVELALRCVACDREWTVAFDIVTFLWDEVVAWSRRLVREVHQLASTYGWAEADIVGMSAGRRALYLEMTGGG